MDIPKKIIAVSNANKILNQSTYDVGTATSQLGARFALLNSQQQASILIKIQNSNATDEEKRAEIDHLLSLTKLNDEEKEAIAQKLQLISAKKGNADATKKETESLTQSLGGTKGASIGTAIGSAIAVSLFSAISSYSSSKQAKDSGEAISSGIMGGVTSALSGAGAGAMIGSIVPGIGTAVGAIVGAVGGLLVSGIGSAAGWAEGEAQRAIDKANELAEVYKSSTKSAKDNVSTLESLRDEFEKLSRGVDENGKQISLTSEEYDRYKSLISQIIGFSPNIVQSYNNEGEAVLEYRKALDLAIQSQETAIENANRMYLGRGEEIFGGKKAEYEQTLKEGQGETSKLSSVGTNWLGFGGHQSDLIDILNEVGIEFRRGIDTWANLSADKIAQLKDKTQDIVNIMATKPELFSDNERIEIENILNSLVGVDSKLNNIAQEQVSYLQKWSESQNFYKDIPIQLLDDFQTALKAVNDPLLSYNENIANANKLGKAFASATQADKDVFSKLFDTDRTKDSAQKAYDEVTSEIENLSDDIKNAIVQKTDEMSEEEWNLIISAKLGFDLDLESAKQAVLEAQTELSKFTGEQLAGEFTRPELNLLINEDDDAFVSTATNIKDLRAEFDAWRESVANAARDDSFRVSLENTTEKVTMLKNAMDEQSQSGYISTETYGALLGVSKDYEDLLASTSGGFTILSSETENYINDLVGLAIQQGVVNGYTEEQINSFYQLFAATSNLDNQLDSVQSAYQKLVAAQDEYAANGYLSIDTLQSLLDVGYEYLQYLEFEDGQMRVNEDGFIALANARLDDLEASELQKATNLLNKFSQDAEGAAKLRSEINLLTDSRLADAEAAYNQAMASAMASGGEYADAAKDLADTVSKVRAVIDTTRNSLGSYTRETMNAKSASDSLKDSQNALKNAMSAINTLLSMTISMLKKDYELKKKAIQDQIDAINTSAKAQIDAANAAHKAEKDNLNDLKKSYDKMFKDRKQALDDEHDALKKKIELQIKLLKLQEEEHDYQRDLADKQKEVADIQGELFKIQFDDSIEGQKRRLELEAQLAEKTDALSEFQHDKEIDRQEQALRDELDRISEIHKNKMDLLDQDKQANDDYFDQRMAQLDAEHERTITYLESARDAQVASLDAQIKAIEDYLSTEAGIREEATKLIEGRTQEFYDRLIQYNYLYGSGIQEEVTQAWNNAYSALDKFNVGQLGVMGVLNSLTRQMDEFEASTSRAASQMQSLASIAQSMPTNSLSSNATVPKNLGSMLANQFKTVGKYATGGVNAETGLAQLDGTPSRAEVIFNANDASKLWKFISDADNLGDKIVGRILGGFSGHKAISNMSNVTTNNSNPISVTVGDINIQGSDGSISKNDLGSFRDNIVNTVMGKIVKQHNMHNRRNLNSASV